jgi:hypothetical protein
MIPTCSSIQADFLRVVRGVLQAGYFSRNVGHERTRAHFSTAIVLPSSFLTPPSCRLSVTCQGLCNFDVQPQLILFAPAIWVPLTTHARISIDASKPGCRTCLTTWRGELASQRPSSCRLPCTPHVDFKVVCLGGPYHEGLILEVASLDLDFNSLAGSGRAPGWQHAYAAGLLGPSAGLNREHWIRPRSTPPVVGWLLPESQLGHCSWSGFAQAAHMPFI